MFRPLQIYLITVNFNPSVTFLHEPTKTSSPKPWGTSKSAPTSSYASPGTKLGKVWTRRIKPGSRQPPEPRT